MSETTTECWSVLLAAGRGERMAGACAAQGVAAKQFLSFRGMPLWWHSVLALAAAPLMRGIVLVFPPDMLEEVQREAESLVERRHPGVPLLFRAGGLRRQDSVRNGLDALPPSCDVVLVHDAARPFLTPALVTRTAFPLLERDDIDGVIPGLPLTDTIKEISLADCGALAVRTPDRALLRAVQTPQAFRSDVLRLVHARAEAEAWEVTDDASLLERCGRAVLIVDGEEGNRKITRPEDLDMLRAREERLPCCGWGYDVHRYGGNRPLRLGGVAIPCPEGAKLGIAAHSDGDVLLHALMDAILGCMGGGDIGRLFPDNDPRWENASSSLMLEQVLDRAAEAGVRVVHADLTIIAQKPKFAPHAGEITRNVARLLRLEPEQVNFKATTEEGLGFTGELRGIKAAAMVMGLRAKSTFTFNRSQMLP